MVKVVSFSCEPILFQILTGFNVDSPFIPQLTMNTSLEEIELTCNAVTPRPRTIRRILSTILSDITSTALKRLDTDIYLTDAEPLQGTDEEPFNAVDTPDATSAFHSILSRSVFDGLPAFQHGLDRGVSVWIKAVREDAASMRAIKSHLVALFAPWLDRGVLELKLIPDPDGERLVTCTPATVLSGEFHIFVGHSGARVIGSPNLSPDCLEHKTR